VRDQVGPPHRHRLEIHVGHALEQPLARAEHQRSDVQPQLVDQPGGQVLVDRGRAAGDRDIRVPGRHPGAVQCGHRPVGDEREGRTALHGQRLARVVGQDEHRRVVGRLLAPPASPGHIPLAAAWTEHVAAHDVRAG
jgi:hypothetical protein